MFKLMMIFFVLMTIKFTSAVNITEDDAVNVSEISANRIVGGNEVNPPHKYSFQVK